MKFDAAQADTLLAASCDERSTSVPTGFLPVPLRSAPSSALQGLPIYLKASEMGSDDSGFALYRSSAVPFTPEDRRRLLSNVRCVYIRRVDLARFRVQAARSISAAVSDPTRALSERALVLYETAVELMNELLAEPDIEAHGERLVGLTRSLAALTIGHFKAFTCLFQTSRHDCCMATHMVNVGLWMVPLAHAMGYGEAEDLVRIGQAGLLHDIGKIFVAPEILDSTEKLSPEQWARIARHCELGWEHLRVSRGLHALVKDVCRQHHERMDGTGYPDGLKSNEIHRVARICAVVDSFDAMTAVRPYKARPVSVSEAILALRSETPAKYDPEVIAAWTKLLGRITDREAAATLLDDPIANAPCGLNRRRFKRFQCDTRGVLHMLMPVPGGRWQEEPAIPVKVFDVSRFGLAVLCAQPVQRGRRVRIYLQPGEAKGRRGRRVMGEVMRCAPREDGGYEIGVQLFPQEPESTTRR